MVRVAGKGGTRKQHIVNHAYHTIRYPISNRWLMRVAVWGRVGNSMWLLEECTKCKRSWGFWDIQLSLDAMLENPNRNRCGWYLTPRKSYMALRLL